MPHDSAEAPNSTHEPRVRPVVLLAFHQQEPAAAMAAAMSAMLETV
jgi:hypothetical protein